MAAFGSLVSVFLVVFLIPHIPKQKKTDSEAVFDIKKIFEIMFSKGIFFLLPVILILVSNLILNLRCVFASVDKAYLWVAHWNHPNNVFW